MIDITNLIFGGSIIILNLIPFIVKKPKYLTITIFISLLLAAIKIIVK